MLLIAFGTRPEWIKLKPVIDEIRNKIPFKILYTGQHIDIIDDSLKNYTYGKIEIANDISSNRLDSVVSSIMSQIDQHLEGVTHVMIQGDTTTVFAVALTCFHRGIKVIHLEAGLRTYDNQHPFPEEFNRQATSCIADIHLCATETSYKNLKKENKQGDIVVVGNTVLDNLRGMQSNGGKNVLVTLHRRENHDEIHKWFKALDILSERNPELRFILPIHPNPNVIKHEHLLRSIEVCKPLSHNYLLNVLTNSKIVITDSGGIQEESAFFHKPCIVCRKKTERSEGLNQFSWLCDKPEKLFSIFDKLKDHSINKNLICPYGDAYASKKILKVLEDVIK